jgi:hypothetical protein
MSNPPHRLAAIWHATARLRSYLHTVKVEWHNPLPYGRAQPWEPHRLLPVPVGAQDARIALWTANLPPGWLLLATSSPNGATARTGPNAGIVIRHRPTC